MDITKAKEIFNALFDTVNGRALSMEGRESLQLGSKSFVYGEAVFDPFYELLKEADPKPGQIFVDGGSGTGKAIFVAHFMFDFSKAVGVELVDQLYTASQHVLERYEKEFKPQIAEEVRGRELRFIHGSITDVDYSNVDLVFFNSTCFQEDLMQALVGPLNALKPNAQVITLSKTLNSPAFDTYKQKMFEFSWGQGTAFYQRKLS